MKKNIENKANRSLWLLSLAAAGVITMIPDLAAASDDPLSEPLCQISAWFSGGTGKAIATVAIIFLGIAAFFGKVTWGLALMFAVGIFAIFGATDIIDAIADSADGYQDGGCANSN